MGCATNSAIQSLGSTMSVFFLTAESVFFFSLKMDSSPLSKLVNHLDPKCFVAVKTL
jgi:hypothetical protein